MELLQWISVCVIVLAITAIVRGWEVRLVLVISALFLGSLSGDPSPVIRTFFETFSSEKFVVPICCAMGFAYTLRHTGCDQHLVRLLMQPIRRVRFLLIPGVIFVAFLVNIPVISQTSVAVCVGPVVIPLMRAARFAPATIAACLCLGASAGGELLNPGAPELLTIRARTQVDTTTLARQYLPPLLVPYILTAALWFWLQSVWLDRKISQEESDTLAVPPSTEPINPIKAFVPLLPLVLLFLTGPPLDVIEVPKEWLVAKTHESYGSRLIGVAMLIGVVVALSVSPKCMKDGAKIFFEGTGYGFTHVISLIVTGACFAEGLRLCGLASVLGRIITQTPNLLTPLTVIVPGGFAFVSGSGIASTKGLYDFFYGPASQLGVDPNSVGVLVALSAAAGRTMSPVAAVVLMSATLTGVQPFAIVKRVAPPLLAGLAVCIVLRMLHWA